jgi:arsenate reductase
MAQTEVNQRPPRILFLCVANSARSQMAEGIARALAPPGSKIWSAGSRPTSVRPEAIAVMHEVGIDISHHRSKAVSEIPAAEVDTVVTLCDDQGWSSAGRSQGGRSPAGEEEECPVFLGKAERLHWGLPDPAAVNGTESERLEAFRRTRDDLRQRIAALLGLDNPMAGVPL